MARQLDEILADFDALNTKDYDFELGNFDGQERIRQLCDELMENPHPEHAISILFQVFERMPEADFGAPGELVQTLEKLPNYEEGLVESIRRKPTPTTVWMVNRILNL